MSQRFRVSGTGVPGESGIAIACSDCGPVTVSEDLASAKLFMRDHLTEHGVQAIKEERA